MSYLDALEPFQGQEFWLNAEIYTIKTKNVQKKEGFVQSHS